MDKAILPQLWPQLWENWLSRLHGPMSFRFIFQPTMAVMLAIRAGVRDARAARPPFLWALFTCPEKRGELLRSGRRDIAKVFALAVVLDVAFQLIAFPRVDVVGALLVAATLACLPYALLRGPVNRLCRRRIPRYP